MPASGDAHVDILVGGEACKEYPHDDGKTYIEMDLQHATSYDEEYVDDTPHGVEKSTWPVTPFQVSCRNLSSHQAYWAELHLDGSYVDQRLLEPGKTVVFQGFPRQGKVDEFLMALPRNQRATDGDEVVGTSRLSSTGSVTVQFKPAAFTHTQEQYVPGKSTDFRQANKIEANKANKQRLAEGSKDNMTGTARQGRTIGASDDSMATAGHKRVNIWDKGAVREALTVHYRQRHVLLNLGVWREKEAVASEGAFNALLVKTKEALGRDWLPHAAEVVAAAAAYQLYQLPQPAACRTPTGTTGASILKFSRGDTPSLAVGGGAHARRTEQAQLEARLLGGQAAASVTGTSGASSSGAGASSSSSSSSGGGGGGSGEELWPVVVEGVNSVFSAAALALFGTEDLWFLLRLVAKHDAAACPERYSGACAPPHRRTRTAALLSSDAPPTLRLRSALRSSHAPLTLLSRSTHDPSVSFCCRRRARAQPGRALGGRRPRRGAARARQRDGRPLPAARRGRRRPAARLPPRRLRRQVQGPARVRAGASALILLLLPRRRRRRRRRRGRTDARGRVGPADRRGAAPRPRRPGRQLGRAAPPGHAAARQEARARAGHRRDRRLMPRGGAAAPCCFFACNAPCYEPAGIACYVCGGPPECCPREAGWSYGCRVCAPLLLPGRAKANEPL